jgi:hypothetical protein
VYRHRSVSLNNEKLYCEISEDKIAVCEKTAGLRIGNFSHLNSACSKVSVPVKIFHIQGHNTWTMNSRFRLIQRTHNSSVPISSVGKAR